MVEKKFTIEIKANNAEQATLLAQLIQHSVNTVNADDLIKLLSAVRKKPILVKTAIKFV